jgi:hypothetical protein
MARRMQDEGMGIIQIRDVPDDVQEELARRARAAEQSLQQYMRALVISQARRPDVARIWARAGERARREGSVYDLTEAVEDLRALRQGDHVP